jgi:hypothetical protein
MIVAAVRLQVHCGIGEHFPTLIAVSGDRFNQSDGERNAGLREGVATSSQPCQGR